MIQYAATIFVSAFLLFQVQPLIARYILPWFGGSAAVWSVTLLFFQAALLGGYAYAHFSISRLKPRAQMVVHVVLLGACMFALPIIPPESLKPDGNEMPALRILLLLGASVGLPYLALSATGPLLQAWFARSYPERSPYALYALSNIGSLLALISYPFVVEPIWGRNEQAWNWTYVFIAFGVLCVVSAVTSFVLSKREATPEQGNGSRESTDSKEAKEPEDQTKHPVVMWMFFAGTGTTLLLAYTNQVCLDVASVPFLWVVPLSLYLLSFILTFAGERWYPRRVFLILMVLAIIATTGMPLWEGHIPLVVMICVYMASLFIFCMVCHGEAFRLRPKAKHLTKFYLFISLGGAMGGAFVALVSPLIFSLYNELFAGMMAAGALVMLSLARDTKSKLYGGQPRWAWGLILILTVGILGGMGYNVYSQLDDTIVATRNFYGVFRIKETPEDSNLIWERTLFSGTTLHGRQFMANEEWQEIPTTYYGAHSGVGATLSSYPRKGPMKVGVVGLGTGTLATYAKPGDTYRFYEINERVIDLAEDYFKYLENCEGDYEFIVGDARLQMEREEPQRYDVIVLDAFSSDSIPVHLLTAEAFELYLSHLRPGGVICVHISNRHLDLRPVVVANANHISLQRISWFSGERASTGTTLAEWVIMTNNAEAREEFEIYLREYAGDLNKSGALSEFESGFGDVMQLPDADPDFEPWTDDYSNLFEIIRD